MPATSRSSDTRPDLRAWATPETRRTLRLICAERDCEMRVLLNHAIRDLIIELDAGKSPSPNIEKPSGKARASGDAVMLIVSVSRTVFERARRAPYRTRSDFLRAAVALLLTRHMKHAA